MSSRNQPAVPLKKRARMSDDNIESPLSSNNKSSSQPQSRLDLWGLQENCHAHFDCFSGAAGDMILASCIDAAGPGDGSDQLLKLVDMCIRKGLPELDGEFELQKRRVWRGKGQIAATLITVQSRYEKLGAAPVPLKAEESEGVTAAAVATGSSFEDGNGQQRQQLSVSPTLSMDAHSHAHQHGHQHDHDHEHEHTHSHSHNHQQQPTESSNLSNPSASAATPAVAAAAITTGGHDHSHSHSHERGPLRNLTEISRMLNDAPEEWIPIWVRNKAIKAFTLLAMAEAEVHGAESKDTVHFHEVGAVDSIVDMVGSLIALNALGVRSVTCSRLPIGEGTVKTDHGLLPVPAPAALRLMVGMPTTPGPPGYTGELVTPTGAALMRVLTGNDGDDVDSDVGISGNSSSFSQPGRPPRFTLCKLGVGAGSKDFVNHPNILRLMLGDCSTEAQQSASPTFS